MSYVNNKAADQPAHPRSLISTFVVRCLDGVMSLVSITEISNLMLAFVAEQAGLSLTWLETPEDTFSHDEAQMHCSMVIPLSVQILGLLQQFLVTCGFSNFYDKKINLRTRPTPISKNTTYLGAFQISSSPDCWETFPAAESETAHWMVRHH